MGRQIKFCAVPMSEENPFTDKMKKHLAGSFRGVLLAV